MRVYDKIVWLDDEEIEALIHYHRNMASDDLLAGSRERRLLRAADLEMIRHGMVAIIGNYRFVREHAKK